MDSDFKNIKTFFTNNFWKIGKIPLILEYHIPKIVDNKTIGTRTGKFTQNNYIEQYNEVLQNKNFQIIFQDESLISMYYLFRENGDIEQYHLSFIPSPHNEVEKDDKWDNSMIEYIRIDYDMTGYNPIIHEKQHIHLGVSFPNDDPEKIRNLMRIPISEKIYPWDFIYLISKLVYHLGNEYDEVFRKFIRNRANLINVDEQFFHICFNFT